MYTLEFIKEHQLSIDNWLDSEKDSLVENARQVWLRKLLLIEEKCIMSKVHSSPSIILISSHEDSHPYINEKMIHFADALRDLYNVGQESIDEIADNYDINIEKCNYQNCDISFHEGFVGIAGLNKLRENGLLNFPYTYGMIRRTEYFRDRDETVNFTEYVLKEKVHGLSFDELIEYCSVGDFLSIYLQILYTLTMAHDKIGFSHNNLICENIIVSINDHTLYYERSKISNSTSENKFLNVKHLATIVNNNMAYMGIQIPSAFPNK